jgi:2,4-dienoyl-CoA reductase-like NADH-dependent reductase (Old Yellow Enzyme family)
MCQYAAEDGVASDWHLVHYGARALGGAGLLIVEATAVAPDGRITPGDLGLWDDDQVEPLAKVAGFIRQNGAEPGIQIAHAGRRASAARPWEGGTPVGPEGGGWTPVRGASPVAWDDDWPVPVPLSSEEIGDLVTAFADSARRALEAGFRVIEIHAAHGYLLHTFLSPLSNQRTDAYGGSFENRTRFLREVIEAVRAQIPDDLPFLVRISCTDWMKGGWTVEDSVRLARKLETMGVDLMDCSSAGISPLAAPPLGPGFQTPFAQKIREETALATGAVGLITEPAQADHIVRTGQADLILLGRLLLRDPAWPLKAAQDLSQDVNWPVRYERGRV